MQAKARVCYTLALPGEGGRHKFGVNALALTTNPPGQSGWAGAASLFTGGRDAKIRRWDVSGLDGGAPPARRPAREPACVATYDDHSDWVNDLVAAPEHGLLISASSDNSIKLWSTAAADATQPRATLHAHTDYVKALAYAPAAGLVVSASLDKMIHIYKLDTLRQLAASGGAPPAAGAVGGGAGGAGEWGADGGAAPVVAAGHKDSVYSVAVNAAGTLVASGSVEPDIRLWDARSGRKAGKLVGHTDVVRALLLDPDGRLAVSASSDRTVRLWDVGMGRCLHVCRVHGDAAWALVTDESWRTLYSGGRDGCVYATALDSWESALLAREPAPVVRLAADAERGLLWSATTDSDLRCWPLHDVPSAHAATAAAAAEAGAGGGAGGGRQRASSGGSSTPRRRADSVPAPPLAAAPVATIAGAPAVQASEVLPDKWRVLTRDTAQRVTLWDVLRGTVLRAYEPGRRFDDVLAELRVQRAVPTWFTVDTRAGDLTICLEERSAFSGLLYADDLGLTEPHVAADATINLGWNMLTTLFAPWVDEQQRRRATTRLDGAPSGGGKAGGKAPPVVGLEAPPQSIPLAISEGRRVSVRTTAAETRSLPEHKVPHWVSEALLAHRFYTREKAKVPFFVVPDAGQSLSPLVDGSSRLEALRILRMRQVARYVAQNLAAPISPPPAPPAPRADGGGAAEVPWEEHIEILCNDRVLHPDVDLYSARLLVWKNGAEDMVLVYRRRVPQ